ncbi:MAG TPA: peptidylprolyl isomerase [Trichocoleus sp.]
MIQIPHGFKTAVLALGFSLASLLIGVLPGPLPVAAAQASSLPAITVAYLPPGNAVTDGRALLRNALPIDNQEIRKVQENLEKLSESLRSKRWGPMKGDITKAERVVSQKQDKILAAIPAERQAEAQGYLNHLSAGFAPLREAVENKDKEAVWLNRSALLEDVSHLEELMVTQFPFEVPEEYSDLPQLKGRATVQFETAKGSMKAVIDGYSAPVTAGNFVDLVQRGFYDGVDFGRAEDFYVLQTGDPAGPEDGFVDPDTKQYRAIPLEILVQGDDKPVYGSTLEELGRFLDNPVLPFSAYGTLGMARPGDNPNGGSSQFFFFLFEPELTPAGLNLLDGRYAVFGYLVEGKEVLEQLKQGDRIDKVRVLSGLEHLVEPKA